MSSMITSERIYAAAAKLVNGEIGANSFAKQGACDSSSNSNDGGDLCVLGDGWRDSS
jgi:hypothetical protein